MNQKTYWCDSCFKESRTDRVCSECGELLNDYEKILEDSIFLPPQYGEFKIKYGDNLNAELLKEVVKICTNKYFQNYHSYIGEAEARIVCNDIAVEKLKEILLKITGVAHIDWHFELFPYDEEYLKKKIKELGELT